MTKRVITFHYKLTDTKNKVLDSSEGQEPLTYMEGAEQIIDGLEKKMSGMKRGDKKKILVAAIDAYGLKEKDNHHPLAGMDLTFDVEIVAVREATTDEVTHGHAHGEHGHSH